MERLFDCYTDKMGANAKLEHNTQKQKTHFRKVSE